jgi:hypothetical protein
MRLSFHEKKDLSAIRKGLLSNRRTLFILLTFVTSQGYLKRYTLRVGKISPEYFEVKAIFTASTRGSADKGKQVLGLKNRLK